MGTVHEFFVDLHGIGNMLSIGKIKYYLGLFRDIRPSDMVLILRSAKTVRLMPGDIYIREGELSTKVAYIHSGMMRAYHLNQSGEERTLMLRWEDQIIASHENIIFGRASRFAYEAVEETTLLEADYAAIEEILDNNPKFEKMRHHFTLTMLAGALARMESFILFTPEERYLELIREKPDLLQRVPGKHLATLLGITPVSLSRIRRRLSDKRK